MAEKFNPTEASAHVARWIESYGVSHHLQEVALTDIDGDASLKNQARRSPLDNNTVSAYTEAMKAGAIFPPLVGYRTNKGIVLVDGNHRHRAATRAGAASMLVYIVEADDDLVLDMVGGANAVLNGKEANFDDRVEHGKRIFAAGASSSNAARQVGLSQSTLMRHIRAARAIREAESMGLGRLVTKMSLGHAEKLHSAIGQFDSTTARVVIAAADLAPNIEDYGKFVRSLSDLDAEQQLEVASSYCDKHRRPAINAKKRNRREVAPLTAFKMHATALLKLSWQEVVDAAPPQARDELQAMAIDIQHLGSKVGRGIANA